MARLRIKTIKNEISVLSWSWGASQTSTVAGGGGSGAGKASLADLHIVKDYDAASVPLFKSLAGGGTSPMEFSLRTRLAAPTVASLFLK